MLQLLQMMLEHDSYMMGYNYQIPDHVVGQLKVGYRKAFRSISGGFLFYLSYRYATSARKS